MLQELVLSEAKLSVNAKLIDSLLSPVWVSSRWMSESYSNVTGLHFFSCMVFIKREIFRNNKLR